MSDAVQVDQRDLDTTQRWALIVGGVGLALTAAGALLLGFSQEGLEQLFRSYLYGYLFWIGIPLGSLLLLVLHSLSGGAWGLIIRRLIEAGARTLPYMGGLFLVIALGMPYIYEWTHPEVVQNDVLLMHKAPYLNLPFFLIRTLIYFALWSLIAYRLSSWAVTYDRSPTVELEATIRNAAGPAMLVVVLSITFAVFDWIMTLEPHWFSSIFGLAVGAGMVLATFAFCIVFLTYLGRRGALADILGSTVLRDVGSLTMAFTLIWAYLNFSQYLIIFAANLPEEVTWYLKRLSGGWEWIGLALLVLHFVLPFVLLMSENVRGNAQRLSRVALFILFMHAVDLLWLVKPAFSHSLEGHFSIHWMDITALIGVGGIWLALFLWQLKRQPVIPALALPVIHERAHSH